jgi:putative ABC transport system ATP-binding protein
MAENGFFKNRGVPVKVAKLTKAYETSAEQVRALKGVEWEIGPGEAVALMGPSGCGKALLNLLGGVDHLTGGDILVGDQKLAALSERDLEKYRYKVGFVFSFSISFRPSRRGKFGLPMLIADVGAAQRKQRVDGLLQMVGLGASEQTAGGAERRRAARVAVALSLANDPALILADEPTAIWTRETLKQSRHFFLSLAEKYGKTVIMASHDPKAVEHFKKVYNMRDGNFVIASFEFMFLVFPSWQ